MSACGEQVELIARQEQIQKALEDCGEDMDRMADLLDELQELNSQAADLDVKRLDKKIDQMMPELGFSPDDNDRLVASYRQGLLSRGSCMLSHLHCEVQSAGDGPENACPKVGGSAQLRVVPLCVCNASGRQSASDFIHLHSQAHPLLGYCGAPAQQALLYAKSVAAGPGNKPSVYDSRCKQPKGHTAAC